MQIRIKHVQFDVDYPPDFEPIWNLIAFEDTDAVEIQHAICQTLEFHYGHPVDYVEWEVA